MIALLKQEREKLKKSVAIVQHSERSRQSIDQQGKLSPLY